MNFLEKDLEQIIFDNLGLETFMHGLELHQNEPYKVFRQLNIGKYGIADIVSFERGCKHHDIQEKHVIRVFELKKDVIGLDTLLQCARYARGIKRYLYERGYLGSYYFELVLIGRYLDTSDWIYLSNFGLNVSVYTYEYTLSGLYFTEEIISDYKLSNSGF
jgi:hypothetical protein